MKRIIKFRAFIDLKKFKVMIYEVQFGIDTTMCGCTIEQFQEAVVKAGWKMEEGDDMLVNPSTGESISMYDAGAHDFGEDFVWLDNCEIMQFTGLVDKNKEELYEGDFFTVEDVNLVITFEDGKFCFDNTGGSYGRDHINQDRVGRLVKTGNIYENPLK